MTWIKCAERMPEPNQWVLVSEWAGAGLRVFSAFWDADETEWVFPDGDTTSFAAVTHWQPLPEPPENDNG